MNTNKPEHRIGVFLPGGFIELIASAWPIVNGELCLFRGSDLVAQFRAHAGWVDFGEVKPDDRPKGERHAAQGAPRRAARTDGACGVNAKYRELSAQLARERAWPGPYERELTAEEVKAHGLRPGRYATVASVQVTCDRCGHEYTIAAISTCVPACPRCHFGRPYFPQLAQICIAALRASKKILICGNGGSSAMASHFAAELVVRYRKNRAPLACIALNDPAILTACANDFGYDWVFSRQVLAYGQGHDVLIALSTSGKSRNVLNAIEAAHNAQHARHRGAAAYGPQGDRELDSAGSARMAAPTRGGDRGGVPRMSEEHHTTEQQLPP